MKYKIIVIFSILMWHAGWSQVSENSPLSALGIGDMTPPALVAGQSLAGLYATYYNGYNVNLMNPASYAGLSATAFDVGFDISHITIQDPNSKQSAWGGNFKYLSLSFPLISPVNIVLDRKEQLFKMGMNISLLPVSKMDYRINQKIITEEGVSLRQQYGGKGGLNKLQFGTGAQYRNLSGGINVGVLFGSIKNEKSLTFEESFNSHHTYMVNDRAFSGVVWDAGLLYRLYLEKGKEDSRKDRFLSFGIYGNSRLPVTIEQKILTLRKSGDYAGLDDPNPDRSTVDTIFADHPDRVSDNLPSQLGIGVSYSLSNRLQAGVNFALTNWESFKNTLNIGSLRNSWESAASVEYTPNPNSLLNYWNRVSYRGTVYYNKDPRIIHSEGLDEKGIRVGLGMPIFQQRQMSYFNISLDYGQLKNNIFKENFVRFNIGITLNNNLWFYKRRFE